MRRTLVVALWIGLAAFTARADDGADAYLAGLDALERGDFAKAASTLRGAAEADEENADRHVALGIALVFQERLDDALVALERARRLQPGDRLNAPEERRRKLWTATALAMRGDLEADAAVFPAATRDPYETAVREMSRRYGDPAFRAKRLRDPRPDAEQVRARERAGFPDLARQTVARIKPAQAPLVGPLRQRGLERARRGAWADARADLTAALALAPQDLEVVHHLGLCHLALGAPEGARAAFTRCLTADVRWVDAYVARARAQAALGAKERALADLAVARGLGADVTAVAAELAATAEPPTAPTLADVVADPTRADALVRAVERVRLRGDESYQARLRVLRASGDLVALGAFLYEGAVTTLVEWVEPRGTPRPLRPQDPAAELAAAELVLDEALTRDPGNARAAAFRAACRIERQDWAGARAQLERALERAPDDAVVLDLVARVLDHAAAVSFAAAADLRTTKTWSDYLWIYTRWPSAAELAQAAAYEREARELAARARRALEAAAAAEEGKPRGFVLKARIAQDDGDLATARGLLEAAVAADPAYLAAWVKLAEVTGRSGDAKASALAQHRAANLTHSTAGPMLKWAWVQVGRTAWKSAAEALALAEQADPADPRVAADRAVIDEAKGDRAAAARGYAAAHAIAGAALRLRGVPLDGATPLEPQDVALPMRLAFRAARLALLDGNAAAAVALLGPAAALVERVELAKRYTPVPGAMLPSATDDPRSVPEAPHVELTAVWIRLRLGEALTALGRFDDAARELDWVLQFEQRKPTVVDVGSAIREPVALAAAHRARVAVRQGRIDEAQRLARFIPRARLSPANQAELDAIRAEVAQALGGR